MVKLSVIKSLEPEVELSENQQRLQARQLLRGFGAPLRGDQSPQAPRAVEPKPESVPDQDENRDVNRPVKREDIEPKSNSTPTRRRRPPRTRPNPPMHMQTDLSGNSPNTSIKIITNLFVGIRLKTNLTR